MKLAINQKCLSYGGLSIVAIFLGDQISKVLILKYFSPFESLYITPFFNFFLTYNQGISFGLLKSYSIYGKLFLILIAVILTIWLIYHLLKTSSFFEAISYGCIIGGALGNILDRIRFGKVIDFLDFHIMGYHWPTFNIGDTAIVMSVILIFYYQTWHVKKN